MVVMELSMYPLGKDESVSRYVARCLDVIDSSGLEYRCHAMATEIQGELDQLLEVVRKCFEALSDCPRVECNLRMDYRREFRGPMESRVTSVEQKLGRSLRK
jgi:uncharacterized protein (TIGR00106 family)